MTTTREKAMRPCLAGGCTYKIGPPNIFCRDHWYQVPKDLRDRIWDLFWHKRGSTEHRTAIASAIRGLR